MQTTIFLMAKNLMSVFLTTLRAMGLRILGTGIRTVQSVRLASILYLKYGGYYLITQWQASIGN